MNFHLTHPVWLWAFLPCFAWFLWLTLKSDASTGPVRQWISLATRVSVLLLIILALAGLQWRKPIEGMNVFFLLDRSQSVASETQESAREWVNRVGAEKEESDQAGVIVFGSNPGIEFLPSDLVDLQTFQTVVPKVGTDIESAIRLATAAFPEEGQKRLVLVSDGNENIGRARNAVTSAVSLGATLDVVPVGVSRANDVKVDDLQAPANLKEGQTFDLKIFVDSETDQPATLRLFRNDTFITEQTVQLNAGKNLFAVPQTPEESGFYDYRVQIEAIGDVVTQNNEATGFSYVKGDPTILIVSDDPDANQNLESALRESNLKVEHRDIAAMPDSVSELQLYDAIFTVNISAGDRNRDSWARLESAIRDFGVGWVAIGGERAFTAGGYQDSPLEDAAPLIMEVDSKKVLPRGALVMVMHGMEFNGGDEIARQVAIGALEAMAPQDELGVLVFNGRDDWLFPLQEISGNRSEMGRLLAGINQGDLPSFDNIIKMGYDALMESNANLKHMIVFSDGDPEPPRDATMEAIAESKITLSSILIQGHGPTGTMQVMAEQGNGRFYNVNNAANLPQIFLKETAVVLKTAIIEDPFNPQVVASTELTRGIGQPPPLIGYVATKPKARASVPIVSNKGDPVLAHWQYGLGRSVAFTSDATAKWAVEWLSWSQYKQFWNQVAQWALRKIDASDFDANVVIENGKGTIQVEALDKEGDFRNFLNLRTRIADPDGEGEMVQLNQVGPGRYEAEFDAPKVGAYMMYLMDIEGGGIRGAQSLGANVSYSPEFRETSPNMSGLTQLAELGGGSVLDPSISTDNPFRLNRQPTFQPNDLWRLLLQIAILLFIVDIAIRRIDFDRELWAEMATNAKRAIGLGKPKVTKDESLSTLIASRDRARSKTQINQEAPKIDPSLFEPETEESTPSPANKTSTTKKAPTSDDQESESQEGATPSSPAERLLAAKKRAQRWKE